MQPVEKFLILLILNLVLIPVSLFIALFSLMTDRIFFYIPFIIVTYLTILFFVSNALFNFIKKRTAKRSGLIITIVLLSVVIIYEGSSYYNRNIVTLEDQELDVTLYQPFNNDDRLAQLDHQASLQLTENLPKLDGATALYPLYASFAQATYPKDQYPTNRGKVIVSQTSTAYQNLIDGKVDIIFAAGPSKGQIEAAEEAGVELHLTPIGREAFVFFVNINNPVDNLTIDDIQAIYSGEVTKWTEVGGSRGRIQAFQRPNDSGSQTALENLMEGVPLIEAPTDRVISGMGGIIEETANYANYRHALGFSFRYFSMELMENNEIKHLAINGVYPDKETIRTGEYPISSEFYAITTQPTNSNVDSFIEWILSKEGQLLVEESGYVPVND